MKTELCKDCDVMPYHVIMMNRHSFKCPICKKESKEAKSIKKAVEKWNTLQK